MLIKTRLLQRLFVATTLALLAMAAAAATPYTPLFHVNMAYDPTAHGNITTDYLRAMKSRTVDEAIKRWVQFSNIHTADSIGDLTDLVLTRQAAFELARLYYLTGQKRDGDREMKQAYEIAVYEMPSPGAGRAWCRSNHYCDDGAAHELRRAKPEKTELK